MGEAPGASRRSPSLRARITLAATTIVGVALVVGAIIFFVLLRGALLIEVRAAIDVDMGQVTAQPGGPESLPTGDDDGDEDQFFQVISASGAVLSASGNAPDVPLEVSELDEGQIIRIPGEEERFLVLAEQVDDRDATIVVGRTLEDVDETLGTVRGLLGGAVPMLIALVGLSTWLVVGRALAPVERMRREVDEVTVASLDRRVADPSRSDEIGRLARTMNNMLNRLEQSQRSQRQFISDASHELKSPLASLRQYAEVARSHPDRVTAVDLSEAVLDEGARLERLVHGMLVLARADERSLEVSGEEVDLDDLLLAETRRLRDSTRLSVDASAVGPVRARGNKGLLEQVVRNLVDNAVQHALSQVFLSLKVVDRMAVLAVDDDGPGIQPEQREHVFERFVRLDEARTRNSGGSGLGLSIVQEIVQIHGGTVSISKSPLGGARFEVRLPAVT